MNFQQAKRFITGNRCERGAGIEKAKLNYQIYININTKDYLDTKPLAEEDAKRGTIGIPRVLNIYEDYPFWFTLFTNLGFRVVLSEKSDRKLTKRYGINAFRISLLPSKTKPWAHCKLNKSRSKKQYSIHA